MSLYVQRCTGPCKTVRGVTSFRIQSAGVRSTVCRWCADMETHTRKAAQQREKLLAQLTKEEAALLTALARVRAGIQELRDAEAA